MQQSISYQILVSFLTFQLALGPASALAQTPETAKNSEKPAAVAVENTPEVKKAPEEKVATKSKETPQAATTPTATTPTATTPTATTPTATTPTATTPTATTPTAAAKAPVRVSPTGVADVLPEVKRQLNPSLPSLQRAAKAINEQRAKNQASLKTDQGIAPQPMQLKNEYEDAMRAHYGYLTDLVSQPRYFRTTLALGAMTGSAVLAYWYLVQKTRTRLGPAIQSIDDLHAVLGESTKELLAAEKGFQNALVNNWAKMAEDTQKTTKQVLDPVMRENVLGELSLLKGGKLSEAELALLKQSESVEGAFNHYVDAVRKWVSNLEENAKLIDEKIGTKMSAHSMVDRAGTFSLRTSLATEFASIRELDAALTRTGKLAVFIKANEITKQALPRLHKMFIALGTPDPLNPPLSPEQARRIAKGTSDALRHKGEVLSKAVKDFVAAKVGAEQALVSNWQKLSFEQKLIYGSQTQTDFALRTIEELQSRHTSLVATLQNSPEMAKTYSRNLETAFAKLDEETIALKKILENYFPANAELAKAELGAEAALKVGSVRSYLSQKLRALIDVQKVAAETAKDFGPQPSIQKSIARVENSLKAMRSDLALRIGKKVPRTSLRWWLPKVGYAAALFIPIVMYTTYRSYNLHEEHLYLKYLERSVLEHSESELRTLNLAGLEMQYAAFYTAWEHHPQMEELGIAPPFPAPSPTGTEDPALLMNFMPNMAAAIAQLDAEIANDNKGVPTEIAKLPYAQRLYMKVWTQIFVDARATPQGNALIKQWAWPNEPGKSQGVPGNVTFEKADTANNIDQLISQLAAITAELPEQISTVDERARQKVEEAKRKEEIEKKEAEAKEAAAKAAAEQLPAGTLPAVPAAEEMKVDPGAAAPGTTIPTTPGTNPPADAGATPPATPEATPPAEPGVPPATPGETPATPMPNPAPEADPGDEAPVPDTEPLGFEGDSPSSDSE